MYKFRTIIRQNDGNAYIYLKALLTTVEMTFTVLDKDQYEVVLTVAEQPSEHDLAINDLEPI